MYRYTGGRRKGKVKIKRAKIIMHSLVVLRMKFWSVAVGFVGCLSAAMTMPSLAADKVLIAHGAISNNVEPIWIAKEQGIYKKYGIDAELVFIIAGRAMQAMLAGSSSRRFRRRHACGQRQYRGR